MKSQEWLWIVLFTCRIFLCSLIAFQSKLKAISDLTFEMQGKMCDVFVISDGDIFPSSQTAGTRNLFVGQNHSSYDELGPLYFFLFFLVATFKVIPLNLKICLSQS